MLKRLPITRQLVVFMGALLWACSGKPAPPAPSSAPPTAPPTATAELAPKTDAMKAGPRAEGEAFVVELVPPPSAQSGQASRARLIVSARGTYHVNTDYPMAFLPIPDPAAGMVGERIPLADGQERTPCADRKGESCTITSPLSFTPPNQGQVRIAGTLAFSVCNADRCLIEKEPLAASVAVK